MNNGNESAAPTIEPSFAGQYQVSGGLTKREYFAGLAMQGIASHPDIMTGDEMHAASAAVRWADALLAELEKTND